MRLRDAIMVSAATATFMLIVQPQRLFNPPADAQDAGSASVASLDVDDEDMLRAMSRLTFGMHAWQDGPPQRDNAQDRDEHQRGDGRRTNGRRGGERSQFDRNGGFPPFEPIPDPEIFSSELVALCIEVAREVNPDLADRLREMCDTDPEEFESVMRTKARKILGLAMLKARSPELYGLRMQDMQYEQQADEYAKEMREAYANDDEARGQDLERRLRNVLEVKFALSMKSRHDYIKLMEQHVESMWQSFKDDAGNFQVTIDRQIERYKSPPRRRWNRHRDLDDIEMPPSGGG